MPGLELTRLRRAFALTRPSELAIQFQRCPFCGPSAIVRLRDDEMGIRCVRCGATPVHRAIGRALFRYVERLVGADVCELSARGPLVRYLRRSARSVEFSEYFDDAAPGTISRGVRCEDVQQLTYPSASFDLVTHTEVMEHVPDDRRAFAELRRVMRAGALMLFTVPLQAGATVERARPGHTGIEYLAPPVFHRDPVRGGAPILAFRDYGDDIIDRLRKAGFAEAWIDRIDAVAAPFGFDRAVVCARA